MGKDSEMSNEPVAYINVEERKLEWAKPITWHTPTIAQMEKIPLYTHPVKELTDDEIEEFAYAFELWQLNNPDKALEGIKDFARAILKKASEK
jgi:hypothetical protein